MTAKPIPAQLSAACQAIRPATDDDAVAGVRPELVAAPASTQECSDLLRAAASLRLAVVPRGTGSKLHWGNPPQRCDLVIETTRMDQVVEHAAGDLVATVQAGITLDRLAEVLGSAGQRLALDPPVGRGTVGRGTVGRGTVGRGTVGRGTVGGVLATGVAGPLRLRYGSGRDLLIGITVVRANGTVAKSGGKVVKNVAGYDLGKLLAGSLGTLGLITSATFRLHPVPAQTAVITTECESPAKAAELLAAALAASLAPVGAEIRWAAANAPIELAVAVEGDASGVAERASALAELLTGYSLRLPVCGQVPGGGGELPIVAPPPPPWWGAWPMAGPDGTMVQVAFWPGELAGVLTQVRAAAGQAGLDPALGGAAVAGVLQIGLPPDQDPAAIATFVTGLRTVLCGNGQGADSAPARASVVVLHAPPAVKALVDLFGPVPSLALMRSVKRQFDPSAMLSPGRFAGGI